MMEPDVRIKTNAQGFCSAPHNALLDRNNMLGLGPYRKPSDELRAQLEPGG